MEPDASTAATGNAPSPSGLRPLLQKTSRTFALSIPLLPEPLQTEVAVAYLLFRIIDTFEDATRWAPARRAKALGLFAQLMTATIAADLRALTVALARRPAARTRGLPRASGTDARSDGLAARSCGPPPREQLRRHVARSARGMMAVVERIDDNGALQLMTLQDLRDYCYVVAGIVGEMLTELFVLQSPSLKTRGRRAARARRRIRRGPAAGEHPQGRAGRRRGEAKLPAAPRRAGRGVLAGARRPAARHRVHASFCATHGADRGLVAFNALNLRLAIGTLRLLHDRGPGAKLTRLQVAGMAADVMKAVTSDGVLFPEQP